MDRPPGFRFTFLLYLVIILALLGMQVFLSRNDADAIARGEKLLLSPPRFGPPQASPPESVPRFIPPTALPPE